METVRESGDKINQLYSYIAVFSLYGEYVVRFFLPDGVFLPCDDGLDFFTSAYVCMYVSSSHIARVWINRVRLPILLVVS